MIDLDRARSNVARAVLAAALAAATVAGCGRAPDRPPVAREWTDPGEATRGAWTLYYAALPSTDLDPAVASAYGIAPRPRLAVVTASLVRGGDPKASADASVEIAARTLIGQERSVRTRRVARDGVVSWIGELEAGERETLVFTVRSTIPGESDPPTAEFRREFHAAE